MVKLKVHLRKGCKRRAGRKGGRTTLRRLGRKHFSKASLARKSFRGGRPRKGQPLVTRA